MRKVVITGGQGQLGTELHHLLTQEQKFQIFSLSHHQFDVTDWKMIHSVLSTLNPDIIIHTAAYTNVDKAQLEPEQAYAVNAYSLVPIASVAEKIKARIIFISTDYVFDGLKNAPYIENDLPTPINVYGRSKLLGEQLLQLLGTDFSIVRTSWLYGSYGPNFVKTMLRLAHSQPEIKVVTDQIGSPTYTYDLASFIRLLMNSPEWNGLIHFSNSGSCSWYEFAENIFAWKKLPISLLPCLTTEIPRSAPRPPYSVLSHHALRHRQLTEPRPWEEALNDYLASGILT